MSLVKISNRIYNTDYIAEAVYYENPGGLPELELHMALPNWDTIGEARTPVTTYRTRTIMGRDATYLWGYLMLKVGYPPACT